MEEGVFQRALRLIAAGGFMVALDVRYAGFDVMSDAVGLALALGGLSGLLRVPAATGEARSILRAVRLISFVALLGSALDVLRPGALGPGLGLTVALLPLLALNGLCLALWRMCTTMGRPRAADAWRSTFAAVVSMLDVPAAIVVVAVASGQTALPAGPVGTALAVAGTAGAILTLLHLLVVSTPRTIELRHEALAPIIDLRHALARAERSEASAL